MEQSSSYDEKTVMHQFDRKCKLALKGEIVDYERHLAILENMKLCFQNYPNKRWRAFLYLMNMNWKKAIFGQAVMMWR